MDDLKIVKRWSAAFAPATRSASNAKNAGGDASITNAPALTERLAVEACAVIAGARSTHYERAEQWVIGASGNPKARC